MVVHVLSLTHSLMGFLGEEVVIFNVYKKSWRELSKERGAGQSRDSIRQTCLSYLPSQLL